MFSDALIQCDASPGMFSDETVIEVRKRGGGSVVVFVPSDAVVRRNNHSLVRAGLMERNGGKWAVLPTAYQVSIPVEDESVSNAQ